MRCEYPVDLISEADGSVSVVFDGLPGASWGLDQADALGQASDALVSNVERARRIGTDEKAIRRLRDPLHRSHIGPVETALAALGQRLSVEVSEAA